MEKNEYRLVISIEDGSGENGAIASGGAGETTNKLKSGVTPLVAYNMAEPYINATKQMVLNDVETTTGSTELSSRLGLAMQTAQWGAKALVSAGSGASLAQALGISSKLGAGVGLILSVGGMAVNLAVKQNELNNQALVENEQFQILKGRAGVQFNRSRGGE